MSIKKGGEIDLGVEPCLLARSDNIFVAGVDGSVKVFTENLKSVTSWTAHSVQLFALEAGGGHVYTSSNDSGVRVWKTNGEKVTELPRIGDGGDFGTLRLYGKYLYVGNETGDVGVYEDNKLKAQYNMLEEVKDLAVDLPHIFTVRDLYVTVTEIKPDESKSRFNTLFSIEGKAPIIVTEKYVFILSRDGKTIQLHENNIRDKFKKLQEINVSEMIVTSISVDPETKTLWTAGWDKHVKRWNIQNDKITSAGDISLGACVNAVLSVKSDLAFAATSDGKLTRIEAV